MKQECGVCMHGCQLEPDQRGKCGVRVNKGGHVISENYGRITALALDPIEKKPLRMFYPGGMILSLGSYGCNLSCPFCQNHEIAACSEPGQTIGASPQELVDKALELRSAGNIGLAFTYNEPLISYEFVRDTGQAARAQGLKTVAVTNGSVTESVAEQVLPYLDALNIDLKGFTKEYYDMLGGDLETVKRFIEKAVEQNCHVELTTLIVPGENDSEAEIMDLSEWVASIDPKIPLHVTRFFPNWKMRDLEPTPVERVYSLAEAAKKNLRYVFTGNC